MLVMKSLGIALVMAAMAETVCWLFPPIDRGGVFFVAGTLHGLFSMKEKPRCNAA